MKRKVQGNSSRPDVTSRLSFLSVVPHPTLVQARGLQGLPGLEEHSTNYKIPV